MAGAVRPPDADLVEIEQVIFVEAPVESLDGPNHPMRAVTYETAFEPATWTRERAREVAEAFDALAPGWDARLAGRPAESEALIADVFARGVLPGGGRALEIGSGTGRATRYLVEHFDALVALDLSYEMLVRAPGIAPRVQADAAWLPFPDRAFDAVVLVNALLFADEVARVLSRDGVVVWVNTLGERTPIHLPPRDVARALPGSWRGPWARAAHGLWVTLRRAGR